MLPFLLVGSFAVIDMLFSEEEKGDRGGKKSASSLPVNPEPTAEDDYYKGGKIDPKTGKELPEAFLNSLGYKAGSPIEETCWGPNWYEEIENGSIDPKTGAVKAGSATAKELDRADAEALAMGEVDPEVGQVAYAIGFLNSKRPTVDPEIAEQLEDWLDELQGYLESRDEDGAEDPKE